MATINPNFNHVRQQLKEFDDDDDNDNVVHGIGDVIAAYVYPYFFN